MNFGQALEALKGGKRVARAGWNGKGMWLVLITGWSAYVAVAHENHARAALRMPPWIGMKTADDGFIPWLASQTDLLAEDWVLVGERGTPATFPVRHGVTSVPWAKVEALRATIEHNTGQTLELLAERGGLSARELWYAATGNGPYSKGADDSRAIREWLVRWSAEPAQQ